MNIPKGEFDGSAPAFGKDEQDKSDSKSAFSQFQEDITKVAPPAAIVEDEPKPARQGEEVGDEDKKANRKFRKEFFQEKQKREELEKRLADLEKSETKQFRDTVKTPTNLPRWWTDLYGETEASKKGYVVWAENEEARQQEVIEKTLKTIEAQHSQETQAIRKEEQAIDDEFDSFEESLGTDLPDKVKMEVLQIVDEYSPKDGEGNFLGATIPIAKAYEIYELKKSIPSAQTQQRKTLAGIAGGGKGGQTKSTQSFRPGDWGGWRRVVGR